MIGVSPTDASALVVKGLNQEKSNMVPRNFANKKDPEKTSDRLCPYYQKMGHLEEACFKKQGYPEWFKELKRQKPKKG